MRGYRKLLSFALVVPSLAFAQAAKDSTDPLADLPAEGPPPKSEPKAEPKTEAKPKAEPKADKTQSEDDKEIEEELKKLDEEEKSSAKTDSDKKEAPKEESPGKVLQIKNSGGAEPETPAPKAEEKPVPSEPAVAEGKESALPEIPPEKENNPELNAPKGNVSADEPGHSAEQLAPTAPGTGEEVPAEIRALETSLKSGDGGLPSELYEPLEPGGTLKPSERFSRIPLRPRMSDSNWKRWVGPMMEKNYRIRRNDTLWGISDRLFGNPYLWPKVWQLNAQIGNPHVIDPGLELSFTPGNPNSAPVLAFKKFPGKSTDDLPIMQTSHKLSLMEFLDETLRAQILSPHPPFQYFFLDDAPHPVAKIPRPENRNRLYHDVGDGFMTPELAEGDYSVIRVKPFRSKAFNGYRVRWVGDIRVAHKRATVTRSFAEIDTGDVIVTRKFLLSPLALHEERLGPDERRGTRIVTIQEGYETLASQNMLVGVRFGGSDRGPRPGAILTVSMGPNRVGTLLLIDRDRQLGTAWVVESLRELDAETDQLD